MSKRMVAYNTYEMAFLMFGVKETRKSINTVYFLFFGSETPRMIQSYGIFIISRIFLEVS